MSEEYIVVRTTFDGRVQYITPPGVWRPDRDRAQRFTPDEAKWLAFTESSSRQPARAIPAG